MSGDVLTSTKTDALWLGELHGVLLGLSAEQQKVSDGWMEGTARAGVAFRICRGV